MLELYTTLNPPNLRRASSSSDHLNNFPIMFGSPWDIDLGFTKPRRSTQLWRRCTPDFRTNEVHQSGIGTYNNLELNYVYGSNMQASIFSDPREMFWRAEFWDDTGRYHGKQLTLLWQALPYRSTTHTKDAIEILGILSVIKIQSLRGPTSSERIKAILGTHPETRL